MIGQKWDLNITETEFKYLYGDKVDPSIFISQPKDVKDLILNYFTCKVWRLNRLYTIVNMQGKRIPFRMNYGQHVVYAASLEHSRIVILKSRQQGISTFWLISFLDDALVFPDFNVGLLSQGQAESRTLLKRVGLAWEEYPEIFKAFLSIKLKRDNTEEQGFNNGSTLFIRTSFRSTTLQRLHISELGKIANNSPERVQEVKTGTLQAISAGNTVVIESTAEGDNEFKVIWTNAEVMAELVSLGKREYSPKDFKPVFLSWLDDPTCVQEEKEEESQTTQKYFSLLEAELTRVITPIQRNYWIAQHRELGDAIYQEYPATPEEAFRKVNDGSYYGVLFTSYVRKLGRVVPNLWDKNLLVHVAMDLGMHDDFSLTYFQKYKDEWRIIDEYVNSGEALAHYVENIQDTPYTIGSVICPHDVRVRELGTGKSRLSRLAELGLNDIIDLENTSREDGINLVRELIPNLWVDEKCTGHLEAFMNYSKEWNDKAGVWRSSPQASKHCHVADSIRYMAVADINSNSLHARVSRPKSRGNMFQ